MSRSEPPPDWDRRKGDEQLRKEMQETLGATKIALSIFSKSVDELKGDVREHDDMLRGTDEKNGVFEEIRQLRALMSTINLGILGDHKESLKVKVAELTRQVTSLKSQVDQVQSEQIKNKLDEKERLAAKKEDVQTGLTIRGQNILSRNQIWAVLGVIVASLIAAFGKDAGRAIWENYKNPPRIQVPKGKPTPVPPGLRRRKATKPKPPAPTLLKKEDPEPVSEPEIDPYKPQPAPIDPY